MKSLILITELREICLYRNEDQLGSNYNIHIDQISHIRRIIRQLEILP